MCSDTSNDASVVVVQLAKANHMGDWFKEYDKRLLLNLLGVTYCTMMIIS